MAELKYPDSQLTKATKQAYGMPVCMSTAAAHQDATLGGLGCHSLEVEHTEICVQRLTRALNNQGILGVISRALFDHQKQAVDRLSAEKIPHILNHSMRVRQAMSYLNNNITICQYWLPQDNLREVHSLAKTLKAVSPNPGQWDIQLVQDLHLLDDMEITTVEQLLNARRGRVKLPAALLLMVGKRRIKAKHVNAWNRVTYYLTTDKVFKPTRGHTPPICLPLNMSVQYTRT